MRFVINADTQPLDFFDFVISTVIRNKQPAQFLWGESAPAGADVYHNVLWLLWSLGYPISSDGEPNPVFPAVRWSRPFILRTNLQDFRSAAEWIGIPVNALEDASVSPLDVRYAFVDASLWDITMDMLPEQIQRVAIVRGKDSAPLPKAEIYLLLSHYHFFNLPEDHQPHDVIPIENRLMRVKDVQGGEPWKDRALVACVIDKQVLQQNLMDFYVECCERLNIPTIPPDPAQASHFKHILYPISEHVNFCSAPPQLLHIASTFCVVHTTLRGGNTYPFVCRDFSYARDYELILHALTSLSAFTEYIEDNPLWLVKEIAEFLKLCTYEGVLQLCMGCSLQALFLV